MRFPSPASALFGTVLLILINPVPAGAAAWTQPLASLRAVGAEGKGNLAAAAALRVLERQGAEALLPVLEAMDGANDYALNWLRAAAEGIAARETGLGRALPVDALLGFVAETRHQPRARRLAFELVARAQPELARARLAGFLNDPGSELRREAVEQVIGRAASVQGSGDKAAAVGVYQEALRHARDVDQIELVAKNLKDLGSPVDLQKTLGWVTRWKVVAPFDNKGGGGFAAVYPPEAGVDVGVEYDGVSGKVRWKDWETKDDYGKVDFNKAFTALKGATGYAYAEVWSETSRSAEVRLGCKNGWKVWVNGRYLFGRDEYHRGAEIDQYRLTTPLNAGRNTILVKLCQNEQTEDWASEWEFQLRVTDTLGTPLAFSK